METFQKILRINSENFHDMAEQFLADVVPPEPVTIEHFGRRILFYNDRTIIGESYLYPLTDQESKVYIYSNEPEYRQWMDEFQDYILDILDAGEIPEKENELIGAPWKLSRPNKQDRDRKIWISVEENNTWEDVADYASCSVNTAKENYKRMKEIISTKTA